METVFVYGSLRQGMGNHRHLLHSELLCEAHLSGFDMYQVSSFPAIIPGNGSVKGELYLVDDTALARLDRLEGHPRMYRREMITVQAGDAKAQVWAYVWQRSVEGLVPVTAGDWVEFFQSRRINSRYFSPTYDTMGLSNFPTDEYNERKGFVMSVQQVIQTLARRSFGRDDKEALISQLHSEVEPLCKTSTGGLDDTETSLYDWLYEGDYNESDTPESIAAEWDSLSE